MRSCYICGRETSRRQVVEPLLVPVCPDRACLVRAVHLTNPHCSARLDDGSLCGASAAPHLQADGRTMCPHHLRDFWEHNRAA